MHGSKPRQESRLLFLHVSYRICKNLDVLTDFLVDRHTWSPHGKGRDVVPSYRRLARRQVGSEASRKQECLLQWIHTRCTMVRRTLPWCKKRYKEHTWAFIKTHLYIKGTWCSWTYTQAHTFPPVTDREVAKLPCSGAPLPPPDFKSPQQCASHANLSSPLQLSLVYSEPSISAWELCHSPLCQLCHPVWWGSTKIALLLRPNSEPVWECASHANLSPPL